MGKTDLKASPGVTILQHAARASRFPSAPVSGEQVSFANRSSANTSLSVHLVYSCGLRI